jgi:hypothetical protein
VFGVDVKPHHRATRVVRAEYRLSPLRYEGREEPRARLGRPPKPWRQKGTGRARAGTTAPPQWTGGGVAFAAADETSRQGNQEEKRAAFRSRVSEPAQAGTIGVLAAPAFASRRREGRGELARLLGPGAPGRRRRDAEERRRIKSFRNLEKVLVTVPASSRSPSPRGRAGADLDQQRPPLRVVARGGLRKVAPSPTRCCSPRSSRRRATASIEDTNTYSFRIHPDAHKTQVRPGRRGAVRA